MPSVKALAAVKAMKREDVLKELEPFWKAVQNPQGRHLNFLLSLAAC